MSCSTSSTPSPSAASSSSSTPSASVSSSSRPDDGSSSSSTLRRGRRARGRARRGARCRSAASRRVSSATAPMPTRSSSSSATVPRVVALLGPAPAHLERDEHVLARGQAAERLEPLERARDAEPGAAVRAGAGDVGAVEPDVTADVGRLQPGDHVEERGLARAVRPDEPGDAARPRHRDRRVVEREQAAERHRDRRRCRGAPSGQSAVAAGDVGARDVVGDRRAPRSRMSTSASVNGRVEPELADLRLGESRPSSPRPRPCASLRHGSSGAKPSPIGTTAPDGFWMMPSAARPGARNSSAEPQREVPVVLDDDRDRARTRPRTARPRRSRRRR